MRSIGIKDLNGNDIFEGDTVTFSNTDIYLKKEWLDALKIDAVTAYIVPQNGRAGSEVDFHFFSNGVEVYTYDKKYELLLEMHKDEKDTIIQINDWFNSLEGDTSRVVKTSISEKKDTLSFSHQFKYQDKIITDTSEDKDKDFDLKELTLSFGGKEYSVHQSFKAKITEEQKKRVLEVHNSLYEYECFKGDFSYIIFTPKEVSLSSHSFETKAVNEKGEHTLYGVQESPTKKMEEMSRILKPMRESQELWRKENEDKLSSEEFEKIWEQKGNEYREKLAELKKQVYKEEVVIDELFMGFGVSDDVLEYLHKNGCEITPI